MIVSNIFMVDFIRMILIMSLSGSLLALILLFIKPLIRYRLPQTAQYILWLIVLAALLVPVSTFIVLPDTGAQLFLAPIHTVIDQNIIAAVQEINQMSSSVDAPGATAVPKENMPEGAYKASHNGSGPLARIWAGFIIIYPYVVLLLLLRYVISYAYFMGKIRFRKFPHTSYHAEFAKLCGSKRVPRLFICPLVATPMLIGFFRPMIILPDRTYTNSQIENIFLHELAHLHRRDIVFKWVSVFACALHWFNPVIWLVRREINRSCELSCDASVIRNMNLIGKQNYGDTLISLVSSPILSRFALATTMYEERSALKERLTAIMKHKKYKGGSLLVSSMLLIAVTGAACMMGAFTGYPSPDVAIGGNVSAAESYTIGYNMNLGTPAISEQTKSHGTDLTLDPRYPERANMLFMGWVDSAGDRYQPGDTYTLDADTTMQAIWHSKIIFVANGGSGAPDYITRPYTYEPTMLPVEQPSRPGYAFLGWSEDPAASAVEYHPGEYYSRLIAHHITLYAVWQKE